MVYLPQIGLIMKGIWSSVNRLSTGYAHFGFGLGFGRGFFGLGIHR
jgi:hypothetical protein